MASRLMSDAEVRRRKKMQGHISQTTSTLGLGGLGVTGVAALAAKKPGVLRAVQKIPKMKNATPKKMKDTAINTGIVSGGISGYSAPHAVKAVKASRKVKPKVMAEVQDRTNSAGKPYKIALGSQGEKAIPLKALKAVGHHGGRAAAGAAVTAGAVGAHQAIKRKREGSWQSYGKRDGTSAFGVDHTEWTAP
jgi:hypothetical protein